MFDLSKAFSFMKRTFLPPYNSLLEMLLGTKQLQICFTYINRKFACKSIQLYATYMARNFGGKVKEGATPVSHITWICFCFISSYRKVHVV